MTRISCIVPTHSRPDLLREALQSIANQTALSAVEEVLVVDDLDEPETDLVVREAIELGVPARRIVNAGSGASASRNIGAAAATGLVLAFLDDDDLWDADYLRESIDRLSTSSAEMVVTSLDVLEVSGERVPFRVIPSAVTPSEAAARNPGFTGSNFVILRATYLANGGFDESLPVSNDKDFLVRFLLAGYRYAVVTTGLVVHRRHTGPQLTASDERRARGLEQFIEKHHDVLTPGGRRFLRKTIHAIRRRTARSRFARLQHTIAYLANMSRDDLVSKWNRRHGGFSEAQR
jgi:glycosyltransferase involved in cell wall biosynthesis